MRVGEQAARDGPAGGVSSLAEFGTIGSVPAVVNVAIDALSPLWIVHLDMPLHPERVWRAIQAARAGLPS